MTEPVLPVDALATWLADTLASRVRVTGARLLSGGAIQQNWAVDLEISEGPHAGAQAWVLRTDAPSSVAASRSRAEEFALLRAAHGAGVTVPEPLLLCAEDGPLGRPFFLMRRVGGIAAAHRVVRSDALCGGRESLAAALGRELARIHTIRPPRPDLAFLGEPDPRGPALELAGTLRARLDAGRRPRPVLEWGLRHLLRHAPPAGEIVLCHNDFRTGNYMVDEAGITGVLDWEFAGWGDPHADLGWLCARCWRFGNNAMEAGGAGPRAALYAAYEAASGRRIDDSRVRFWELAGTLRWAVIAIDQAERHIGGGEQSLELALTGHILPELELDILRMTETQGA